MGETAKDIMNELKDSTKKLEEPKKDTKIETITKETTKVVKEEPKKEAKAEVKVEAKLAEKKLEAKAEVKKEEVKKPEVKKAEPAKTTAKKHKTLLLDRAVTIYRGPSTFAAGRKFKGLLTLIGTDDLFTKVTYVRSGVGQVTGYVLLTDDEKKRAK